MGAGVRRTPLPKAEALTEPAGETALTSAEQVATFGYPNVLLAEARSCGRRRRCSLSQVWTQRRCLLRQCRSNITRIWIAKFSACCDNVKKLFCILILRIVRIGFKKQYNQINNYAYSAKSRSTDVQYSEKDTPLVKFMRSEQSEKQA